MTQAACLSALISEQPSAVIGATGGCTEHQSFVVILQIIFTFNKRHNLRHGDDNNGRNEFISSVY